MQCPRCDADMITVEYRGIEVDYCEDHGVWLDSGELELLFEISNSDPSSIEIEPVNVREEQLRCAYCGEPMEKVRICGVDRIIDRCPKGHGLWFDKGELRAVLEHAAGSNVPVIQFLRSLFGDQSERQGEGKEVGN